MGAIKHYCFDDDGHARSLEEGAEIARRERERLDRQDSEDNRCANCGRRSLTSGPYALCTRCSDEMNRGWKS